MLFCPDGIELANGGTGSLHNSLFTFSEWAVCKSDKWNRKAAHCCPSESCRTLSFLWQFDSWWRRVPANPSYSSSSGYSGCCRSCASAPSQDGNVKKSLQSKTHYWDPLMKQHVLSVILHGVRQIESLNPLDDLSRQCSVFPHFFLRLVHL